MNFSFEENQVFSYCSHQMIQWNPYISNSSGTEKIVRKIGGSRNWSIHIKRAGQLKNTKYTCCTLLYTFTIKTYNMQIKLYVLQESVNCILLLTGRWSYYIVELRSVHQLNHRFEKELNSQSSWLPRIVLSCSVAFPQLIPFHHSPHWWFQHSNWWSDTAILHHKVHAKWRLLLPRLSRLMSDK